MMATSWTGHRKGTRLISPGLPGAAVLLVLVAVIAVFAVSRPAAAARRGDNWVTGWSASPQGAMPGTVAAAGFDNQTVRDIIFTSVGGDPIRLELTNAFGTAPLQVGHVTVAVAGLGAAAVPGTIHPVTFGGSASVRIPAGAQVLSDPVGMQVWPLQDLAVSVYLPGRTGAATFHSDAQQVNWVSAAGDHAAEAGAGAFTTLAPSWYYLSGLSVRSSGADGTVVAFGDSITDGLQSTVGANLRWPNDLARRLDALAGPGCRWPMRDRRQPGADWLAVLRCQRRGAVRTGCAGPARCPGHHRAGGDQRHRVRRGSAELRAPISARPGSSPGTSS